MKYFRYKQKKSGQIIEFTEDQAAKIHNNKALEFLGDSKGGKNPPKGRQTEIIKGGKITYSDKMFE